MPLLDKERPQSTEHSYFKIHDLHCRLQLLGRPNNIQLNQEMIKLALIHSFFLCSLSFFFSSLLLLLLAVALAVVVGVVVVVVLLDT